MADADWPAPDPVDPLARLAAKPTEYGFYRAMRELEAFYRDRPRFGRSVRPAQDAVRLAQEPSSIFAPATLAAFEPAQRPTPIGAGQSGSVQAGSVQAGSAQGGAAPFRDEPFRAEKSENAENETPARLLVHFFGLFGPDGPLPLHLTDYARDRRRNARDPSFQRFADVFHHRALSLFYRAWADSRPTISFDRPETDRFALYVGALIGLGMDSLLKRDAMPDLTKLHFAGRLANQTRHPEGLGAILSAFFTMPVRVECFVGVWLDMPGVDQTGLGLDRLTGTLGRTAMVGRKVWSRQHKFRIVFGPLSLAEYLRLLPGGLSFHRLIPIVRNYVGDTLLWDVNLVLRAEDVPPVVLGRQGRLGWTSWLTPRRAPTDAADLFLDASADSQARRIDAATSLPPEPPPEASRAAPRRAARPAARARVPAGGVPPVPPPNLAPRPASGPAAASGKTADIVAEPDRNVAAHISANEAVV
jgi:type VI secretion system protein ImpH